MPAVVGMPTNLTVVPLTVAFRPGGRFAWALTVSGPVPPLIGKGPVYDTPAVPCVGDSMPSVGVALTVMLKVRLARLPPVSRTLKVALKVPAAVGVPLTVMVLP